MSSSNQVEESDFVWGARDIGEVLCLSERAAFHLLAAGKIPAARKFHGRWCASRRALLQDIAPPPLPDRLRDLVKHLTPDERRAFFGGLDQ
jgi:hypothetical protein